MVSSLLVYPYDNLAVNECMGANVYVRCTFCRLYIQAISKNELAKDIDAETPGRPDHVKSACSVLASELLQLQD